MLECLRRNSEEMIFFFFYYSIGLLESLNWKHPSMSKTNNWGEYSHTVLCRFKQSESFFCYKNYLRSEVKRNLLKRRRHTLDHSQSITQTVTFYFFIFFRHKNSTFTLSTSSLIECTQQRSEKENFNINLFLYENVCVPTPFSHPTNIFETAGKFYVYYVTKVMTIMYKIW